MITEYTVIYGTQFEPEHKAFKIQLNCNCPERINEVNFVKTVILDTIFAGCNRGSSTEFNDWLNLHIRSMSVGDYVYDHQLQRWFYCAMVGWDALPIVGVPESVKIMLNCLFLPLVQSEQVKRLLKNN